jgi:DNA repair exonuclease SbcCD ATPase subunit
MIKKLYIKTEALSNRVDDMETVSGALYNAIGAIDNVDIKLSKLNKKIPNLKLAVAKIDHLAYQITTWDVLESQLLDYIDLEREIKIYTVTLQKVKPLHERVKSIVNVLVSYDEDIDDLSDSVEDLDITENKIAENKERITKMKKEYETLLKKSGSCPLCYSELTEKTMKIMMENL